jgi:hypothetical protein
MPTAMSPGAQRRSKVGKWNMIELATKHGALLERLLAKSGGALGEILVGDAIGALGATSLNQRITIRDKGIASLLHLRVRSFVLK